MHPRQSELVKTATEIAQRLAGSKSAAAPILWKYTDPDGKAFYLEEKKMTVRSPFSGKSFTTRPERQNMGQVTKELREDATPAGGGPGGKTTTKRKRASEEWKA